MSTSEFDDAASDRIVIDVSGKSLPKKMRFKIKLSEKIKMLSYVDAHEDDRKNEEEDRDDDYKVMEEEEYSCSLCEKGFRSRKALGGHMRVHAQHHQQQERRNDVVVIQDHQLRNALISDMEETDDVDDVNEAICCPICGRIFQSNKALFGHMRTHPERSWRGIQPPVYINNNNNSSSSTVSDVNQPKPDDDDDAIADVIKEDLKQVVDLEKKLLGFGWGAKAIRGRDAITTNPAVAPAPAPAAGLFADMTDIEPEQIDGVQSLILLSQGDSCLKLENNSNHDDQLTLRPTVSKVRDNVNDMMMNKKKLKINVAELKRKTNSLVLTAEDQDHERVVMTTNPNKKFKVTDHNSTVPNGYNAADLIKQTADTKKQIHKVRNYLMFNKDFKHMSTDNTLFQPTHSSPVTIKKSTTAIHHQVEKMELERYKCTTCNKCFSSHQALGGHKSSHNKQPNNVTSTSTSTQAQGQCGEAASTLTMVSSGPMHQCNVCFKIYPSGQALGGHKRLHCSTTTSSQTPPPPRLSLQTLLYPNMVSAVLLPSLTPAVPSFVVSDQQPLVADTASAAPTLTLAPGVIKGFDLNELPPIEDDDNNTTTTAEEQPQSQQEVS